MRRICTDGVVLPVLRHCDQIDAGVFLVISHALRPLCIGHDIAVQVFVGCFVFQIADDQFLEIGAFFPFCYGGFPEIVEYFFKRGFVFCFRHFAILLSGSRV